MNRPCPGWTKNSGTIREVIAKDIVDEVNMGCNGYWANNVDLNIQWTSLKSGHIIAPEPDRINFNNTPVC